MKKTLSILIFLVLISGCRKTHSPNYLLFDFDLNKSYTIESTFDTILINNGLLTYSTSSLSTNANIWLTDGEIQDTLNECCGAWNYLPPLY